MNRLCPTAARLDGLLSWKAAIASLRAEWEAENLPCKQIDETVGQKFQSSSRSNPISTESTGADCLVGSGSSSRTPLTLAGAAGPAPAVFLADGRIPPGRALVASPSSPQAVLTQGFGPLRGSQA